MKLIPTVARNLHIIKKEIPLLSVAVLSLFITDNQASAYEVYDIINVENLNFPMEGFPNAEGVFYDGTITADKCELGNTVFYPRCNLIRSGTTYGIRQLNLADNMLCFNSNKKKVDDGSEPSNSVLYTTNYAAKLKSVTLLSGPTDSKTWYLYGRVDAPYKPGNSYGGTIPGSDALQQLTNGKESTITLSTEVSNHYKWYCITPRRSPKLKYIQLCWIIEGTNPELYYYGPGMQSGEPCNVEYGSEEKILPEVRNPLNLALTYNSSNTDVATIDENGNVTINKIGQTIISANPANPAGYGPSQARYLLNVQPSTPTFKLTNGIKAIEKEEGVFYLEYGNASSVEISFNAPSDGATIWYKFKQYDPTVLPESVINTISPSSFTVGNQSEYKKYDGTPITVQKGNDGDVTFFSEENGAKSKIQKIVSGIPTGSVTISTPDSDAAPEYFNLEGNRISHPEKGIYIVRHCGKTKKIIK